MRKFCSVLVFMASIQEAGAAFAAQEMPIMPVPYDSFAYSAMVDNLELSRMRGGFSFGPIGIDMDFIAQINVENITAGIQQFDEFSFTTAQNAEDMSQQILNNLQPIIIQNDLPGTLIQINQMLDVTVTGALNNAVNNALADSMQTTGIGALY